MKFDLIIKDASKEEILALLAVTNTLSDPLNGRSIAVINGTPSANGSASVRALDVPGATPMPSVQHSDENGAPNPNAPAVDNLGLPHDIRIHSDNKGLNKDGTWRKRRGVDDAMVVAVEAELKARAYPPPPQQQQQYQPNPNAPMMPQMPPPQQQYQPNPNAPMMPQMPPPQQQYAPPPGNPNYPPQDQQPQYAAPQGMPQYQPQQQPAPMDFTAFMQHLSGRLNVKDQQGNPLITTDYLAGVVQRLSLQTGVAFNAITELANNPHAIPLAVQIITADGRWI